MHWTIGAIIYAESAKDAESEASNAFEELVKDSYPFDYFTVLKDGVHRVNSPKGKEAVEELIEATRDQFMENLGHLKTALARMSDEEAFSERAAFNLRWRAHEVGKFTGGGIFLYDSTGDGIRTPEQLKMTLTKRQEFMKPQGVIDWMPEEVDDDVWIVLADAHS